MKKKIIILGFIFALLSTGTFYFIVEAQSESKEVMSLTIKATEPSAKLLAELQKDLYSSYVESKKKRNFDINIEKSSEDDAIESFIYDKYKAITICRKLKKDEVEKYLEENKRAPIIIPIYKIPVVVLLHKSNIVEKINLETLKKIFTGEITSWKTLDPKSVDDAIQLFVPFKDSAAYKLFKKNILNDTDVFESAKIFNESELAEQIKLKTAGITFQSRCFVPSTLPIKEAILLDENNNALSTTDNAIRDETYPLVLTIFAYVPEVKPALLDELLTFAEKDKRGTKTILNLKFVKIK